MRVHDVWLSILEDSSDRANESRIRQGWMECLLGIGIGQDATPPGQSVHSDAFVKLSSRFPPSGHGDNVHFVTSAHKLT
jgi:hypothetical protein